MQRLMPVISILILFIPQESWSGDLATDKIFREMERREQACEPVTEASLVCYNGLHGCMTVLGYYKRSCEYNDDFLDLENFIRNTTKENEEARDRLLGQLSSIELEFDQQNWKLEEALNTAKLWKMQANDLEEKAVKALTKSLTDMRLIQRISYETGTPNDFDTTLKRIQKYYKAQPLQERKEIQLVLKARGLYHSEIDGVWGKNTELAFLIYLAPKTDVSNARSVEELFIEMKKGFIIGNLWAREEYEQEVNYIYSDSKKIITIDPKSLTNTRLVEDPDQDFTFSKPSSSTTFRQTGNNIFGSDGSSYRKVGKNIFGSDGTSCRQVGNNLFCN